MATEPTSQSPGPRDPRERSQGRTALPRGNRLHWFTIDAILGRGGFGITYLAHDENLAQQVAIKEYLPSDIAERDTDLNVLPTSEEATASYNWGLRRFIAEARTLAHFRHPNIVPVRMVFEANQTAYMVMDYEAGATLSSVVAHSCVDTETKLRAVIEPLLSGLAEVHGAGFIHRDIKPDNIILRRNASPVLIDFGAARAALRGETRALTTLVTPHYAPFEQYTASQEVDRQGPWTDIYALCATIYRLINGRPPVDAMTRADAIIRNQPDPYLSLASITPEGFSPALCNAVDSGLAFRPEDRPQSVGALRALLPAWHRETLPYADIVDSFPAASMQTDPATGSGTVSQAPVFLDTFEAVAGSGEHTTHSGEPSVPHGHLPLSVEPRAQRSGHPLPLWRLAACVALLVVTASLFEHKLDQGTTLESETNLKYLLEVYDPTFYYPSPDLVLEESEFNGRLADADNDLSQIDSVAGDRGQRSRRRGRLSKDALGSSGVGQVTLSGMRRDRANKNRGDNLSTDPLRALGEWIASIPTTQALPDAQSATKSMEDSN